MSPRTILFCLFAWTAAIVLGLSCANSTTPLPEPPPLTEDAGPPRQGAVSNFAANPAPCAIGTPCLETADPTTGALWVAIANASGSSSSGGSSGSVTIDGGTLTANQGAPNDGGVNAWPVADLAAEGSLADIDINTGNATSFLSVIDSSTAETQALINAVQRTPGTAPSATLAIQGASGMIPIAISGTVSPPTAATLPAIADQAVTTTATALASLAQGPTGVLVRANLNNVPGTIVRIGTNVAFDAGTAVGTQLEPGASFCFPVSNASGLKVMLEATTEPDGGTAFVTVEQC
jgi:hypothetical protein